MIPNDMWHQSLLTIFLYLSRQFLMHQLWLAPKLLCAISRSVSTPASGLGSSQFSLSLLLLLFLTIHVILSFLGLCLQGTFLKGTYCVPNCGPGYYGNNVTRTCRKCDPSCKTCLDGDGPKKCSSCDPPLHIQGKSYEICWSTQIILFPYPLFLTCTFLSWSGPSAVCR